MHVLIGLVIYWLFYKTKSWELVLSDFFVRVWFNVGAILVLVNVCIGAFLIVYITYIKKVSSDDWETHYPAAIPIATGSFIMGAVW